jgi:hypothetical protein
MCVFFMPVCLVSAIWGLVHYPRFRSRPMSGSGTSAPSSTTGCAGAVLLLSIWASCPFPGKQAAYPYSLNIIHNQGVSLFTVCRLCLGTIPSWTEGSLCPTIRRWGTCWTSSILSRWSGRKKELKSLAIAFSFSPFRGLYFGPTPPPPPPKKKRCNIYFRRPPFNVYWMSFFLFFHSFSSILFGGGGGIFLNIRTR